MKIAAIEAVTLRSSVRDRRAADQTHEAALVLVTDDEGHVGVGEAGVMPAVVKAFIDEPGSYAWSQSPSDVLIGRDPRNPRALWDELVGATVWTARVGIGRIALAGIDMALWDLAGKVLGKPVWRLLSDASPLPVSPYLTMYQGPSRLPKTTSVTKGLVDWAKAAGYTAAKIEALPDTTQNTDEIVSLVRDVRKHAGDDFRLALDVGYRWRSASEAIKCVRRLEEFDLLFLETPFMPDLLEQYRRLVDASPIAIAGAEILTSYGEYLPLLDAGIAVAQAGTCRVGITEADRLARYVGVLGRQFVPFGYVSTSFSMAANVHVAAANPSTSLVEDAPPTIYPHMAIRRDLATPSFDLIDGEFRLSEAPGLGVELDMDALRAYAVR